MRLFAGELGKSVGDNGTRYEVNPRFEPVRTKTYVEGSRLGWNEGVWGFVLTDGTHFDGTEPRRLIKFERDVCYVVEPGKNIFEVKPKKLERTDAVTLIAETGFWHYGRVSMRFDSPADADSVEQKLRLLVPKRLK